MSAPDDATGRTREVVLGPDGQPMFTCARCGAPLTKDDFFDLGLRLPDAGERREDYADAELIDTVRHAMCPDQ
ncbi:MAG: hypothetical protein KGK07_07655 [Chloroflexota bacterium]|nr:hypothetical protein [Chloroflexota bacterium]